MRHPRTFSFILSMSRLRWLLDSSCAIASGYVAWKCGYIASVFFSLAVCIRSKLFSPLLEQWRANLTSFMLIWVLWSVVTISIDWLFSANSAMSYPCSISCGLYRWRAGAIRFRFGIIWMVTCMEWFSGSPHVSWSGLVSHT